MHRFTNTKGIELIKQFEGFKNEPYVCSGGYLTIGYGHKLLPSDQYNYVTEERANIILQKDLLRAERAVLKYINAPLSDDHFAALVSFTFNLGSAALQRSTLRQKLNYELYKEASKEFMKWVYAGGKKLPGLVKRRKTEQELFRSSLENNWY
ncbi:MAG: lysozyme [Rickettsiaceae bacterium]|nr:lysozyme [Rickettsiaceae bacterium]